MNTDHYNTLRLGVDPPHFDLNNNRHDGEAGVKKGDSAMQPQHNVRPDEDVLSAWRDGLTEASQNPELKQQLLRKESELLTRFAEHYAQLKHLPRRIRRSLQRHWKRSLAGVAMLLALGQTPAMAATINVGGACTLVRAIVAANNNTTATGHCTKGSGADRIVLPSKSTVTLRAVNNTGSISYVYSGANGLPVVASALTIDGNGSTIRRAPTAPDFRIFAVSESGNLRLQETTVSGGIADSGGGLLNFGAVILTRSTISGNRATDYGGGLSNYGDLTISNSTISNNSLTNNGDGGGVYHSSGHNTTTPSLIITNSTISGNTARFGGGVNLGAYAGLITVTSSTISGNKVSGDGGGVYVGEDTDLTIIDSTISGNTAAGRGGGVCNCQDFTGVTIIDSTISGNKAVDGGGVVTYFTSASLANSTISGNTASGRGGGVYTGGYGYTNVSDSTISGNKAGNGGGAFVDGDSGIALTRTLVSGNTASKGREIFKEPNGYAETNYFNLFGHRGLTNAQALVGVTRGATDITATSNGNRPTALNRILNTTLASNGGPTKSLALVAASPAVDAVTDGSCPPPARDQRGVRRPQDGNGDGGLACDVGAFERR